MGGTISATGEDRLDLRNYVSGKITAEQYLKEIPELNKLAEIEIYSLDNVSSTQINEKHWFHLKEKIEWYLHEQNFDGIVISHGTNTLEETAYFLHLTINTNKPIVLVGSQRPYSALSTDAHMNVLNGLRVAVDEESKGKGVLVSLNDQIHSARDVTKTDTYRLETFQSGVHGILGTVDPDETVNYYRSPMKNHTTSSQLTELEEDQVKAVEIVYSYAGASGDLIRFITESKQYAGIIMAGTGAGRCSKAEEEALQEARQEGIHVVRGSRCLNGRVVDIEPYANLEAIAADDLIPQKARILLMLALAQTQDLKAIQAIFDTH